MPMARNKRIFKVAVFINDLAPNFTNVIFSALADYIHKNRNWRLFSPGDTNLMAREQLEKWKPDGIIFRAGHFLAHEYAARTKIPAIIHEPPKHLRGQFPIEFITDNNAIAVMAADTLLNLGFRNFAFADTPKRVYWSQERKTAFSRYLKKKGHSVHILPRKPSDDDLLALPRPCAIFATYDPVAERLVDHINRLGLKIPDDLAIISRDNRFDICETSLPSISSMEDRPYNLTKALYRLEQLMRTGKGSHLTQMISPARVIMRESLPQQVLPQTTNPRVAKVISEIQQQFHNASFTVASICNARTESRRFLEKEFLEATGHGIAEEIRRQRIMEMKRLLHETNLPISIVIERCGYCSPAAAIAAFRKVFGTTPSAFRNSP